MKLLITGYSGFIGNKLVSQLQGNYELNLLGRKPSNLGCVYTHNIDPISSYSDALDNVEVVVHCAARVHIMNDVASDPLNEFRAVNTLGTLNLAKQASQAGVKRFIFLSTIKVNGESTTGKASYTAHDQHIAEEPYGISKSEAEEELMELGLQTGMEIVVIRPALVYGYGVKANFSALLNLVIKKIPLPFGSIKNNQRSLVSVYNLVDLIVKCIYHPNAANQTFLVSDDHDLSTTEMVKLMAKVQGVNPWLVPVPVWILKLLGKVTGKSDMISRLTDSLQVDITHTKETLNWTPPYSVEEGFAMCVQKTIERNEKIEK